MFVIVQCAGNWRPTQPRYVEYVKEFTINISTSTIAEIWLQVYHSRRISASERTLNRGHKTPERNIIMSYRNIVTPKQVHSTNKVSSELTRSLVHSLTRKFPVSRVFRSHRSRTIINCKKKGKRKKTKAGRIGVTNQRQRSLIFIDSSGLSVAYRSLPSHTNKREFSADRRRRRRRQRRPPMSTARVSPDRLESYYENFIGMPRAREDRERCRVSSCIGALIASRFFDAGAHESVVYAAR